MHLELPYSKMTHDLQGHKSKRSVLTLKSL